VIEAKVQSAVQSFLQTFMQTVDGLKAENKQLTDELIAVRKELQETHGRVDQLEQYSRLDNLVITGLPSGDYAEAGSTANNTLEASTNKTTELGVLNLVNDRLGVPLTLADISTAHRLKKGRDGGQPPPVLVRFTSRKVRDSVYAARRKVKATCPSIDPHVFINEDLTRATAEVFRQARGLVKQGKLHGTWTAGGTVYAKRSSAVGTKPEKISKLSDLQKY
jgi:hypothetical protein